MCGRYALHSHPDVVALQFGLGVLPAAALAAMVPRYNIAPTQDAPIVRFDPERGRELVVARWGLVPAWAKDTSMGAKMINARAETVAEKPSFRSAWRKRRCLVPADGWYEWFRQGETKTPHYMHARDDAPLALAAEAARGFLQRKQSDHRSCKSNGNHQRKNALLGSSISLRGGAGSPRSAFGGRGRGWGQNASGLLLQAAGEHLRMFEMEI